jgi:peptide deformylase
MKTYKILKENDLSLCSSDHVLPSENIISIVNKMWNTLEYHHGIGLAAPQVGIIKRIIIIKYNGVRKTMINPKILEHSDRTNVSEEGCLSFPGKKYIVSRYDSIIGDFFDLKGNLIKLQASGIFARLIQHEIDHLDGKNISRFKRS